MLILKMDKIQTLSEKQMTSFGQRPKTDLSTRNLIPQILTINPGKLNPFLICVPGANLLSHVRNIQ